jgi:hypothetical protein
MSAIGFVVGLSMAILSLVLLVHRPAECGEPAACGDDYLFPVAYLALTLAMAFPVLSWVMAGKSQCHWLPFLYRLFGVSAATAALLLVASRFVN